MTRLFFKSSSDPRKLSQLWHQIARQQPSRREHVHGRIHAMDCRCSVCRKIAA